MKDFETHNDKAIGVDGLGENPFVVVEPTVCSRNPFTEVKADEGRYDEFGAYWPPIPNPSETDMCVEVLPTMKCNKCGRSSMAHGTWADECPNCGRDMVKCPKGHEYDANFFERCPQCISKETNLGRILRSCAENVKNSGADKEEVFAALTEIFERIDPDTDSEAIRRMFESELEKLG